MSGFFSMLGIGAKPEPAPYAPPKLDVPEVPVPENQETPEVDPEPKTFVAPPAPQQSNPRQFAAPLDLPVTPAPVTTSPAGVPKKRVLAKRPGQAGGQPAPAPVPPPVSPEKPVEVKPPVVVESPGAVKPPVPEPVQSPPPQPTPVVAPVHVQPKVMPPQPVEVPAPVEPKVATAPPAEARTQVVGAGRGTRKPGRAVRPGQGVAVVAEAPPEPAAPSKVAAPQAAPPTEPKAEPPKAAVVTPAPAAPKESVQNTEAPATQPQSPEKVPQKRKVIRKGPAPGEAPTTQSTASQTQAKPQPVKQVKKEEVDPTKDLIAQFEEHRSESEKTRSDLKLKIDEYDKLQDELKKTREGLIKQLATIEEQKKGLLARQTKAIDDQNYEEAERIDQELNEIRLNGKKLHQEFLDSTEKWINTEASKKNVLDQFIKTRNDEKTYLTKLTDHTGSIKAELQKQIDQLQAKINEQIEVESKIEEIAQSCNTEISGYENERKACDKVIETHRTDLDSQINERKEIDDAWAAVDYYTAEIESVSSKVSSLRREVKSIEATITNIRDVVIAGLEQEKKAAVTARNFRHATSLTAEIKHQEEEIETQIQLKTQKENEVKKVQESSLPMQEELAAARSKIDELEAKAANIFPILAAEIKASEEAQQAAQQALLDAQEKARAEEAKLKAETEAKEAEAKAKAEEEQAKAEAEAKATKAKEDKEKEKAKAGAEADEETKEEDVETEAETKEGHSDEETNQAKTEESQGERVSEEVEETVEDKGEAEGDAENEAEAEGEDEGAEGEEESN